MATLDRKVPSPNTFLYKPWSAFIEAVKLQNSDIAHVEDIGKEIGNGREARKLNREDMHLYGQYPAYDDFCLVVCNICSQVVKPPGILSHYERRHAPSCDSRPPLTQRPKVSHSSPPQPRPFRPPRDSQHPFSRVPQSVYPPKGARKPCLSVPVVSLEKMSCLGRVEGPHVRVSCPSSSSSSSSSPAAPVRPLHKPQERVLNGRPPPALLDRKHQNGTKANKPYKRVSGRVFDPNKHCGVPDPESRKPCTRSLTCKTHSLTHRRAVPGRGKQFDSLLAEHKGRHLREQQGSHARPTQSHGPAQSHDPTSSASTDCHEGRTTSLLKSRLAGAHIPRPLGGWSSVAQSSYLGSSPDSVPPCPVVEGGDRLSSEEGEVETLEDLDCPYSPRHPRPMGCCSFGGRLMGRGYYVFDRRRDRMRLALRCMVEKHVTSQMWRKIPLATESRAPYPRSQPALRPLPPPPSSASLPPPLLPSSALTTPSNSVSMVTYSTAFPHRWPPCSPPRAGSPAPDPASPRECASRPPEERAGPWEGPLEGVGLWEGAWSRAARSESRRSPLLPPPTRGRTGETTTAPRPRSTPHQSSPTHSSNGTSPLCAKTLPPGHGPPRLLPFSGDHAHISLADGRKRKSSSPNGRPAKTAKSAALNSIFRQSGGSLLAPGHPPSHHTLPRQPKVHH
ncbi:hypothetical protein SKAU_G00041960 [Synaphobranchus kaupii]|uniref:SCA7 domain-containing protein n=1 Tax=Synaphobranchus kaupii TaxID=118154 RepID=A0A9Q1G1Q1_SYNKA|nr:hypothetical protein SKAU_G00041960 [Synaphobranchus kaupii]